MTKTQIEIKLSRARADVKKYEKLLQKGTIHDYDRRQENKDKFMKYVRAKNSSERFVYYFERILDEYLELDIAKDKFDLYKTVQYAMNGNWDYRAKLIKKPFFEVLKYCVDNNINCVYLNDKSDSYHMIREH